MLYFCYLGVFLVRALTEGGQKPEQTPVLTDAEFKAFSTFESPRQIWSSKARVMALGGRVPYYQVPSTKTLFGSILILLCNPEWNPQDIARTLKLNGFMRILIQGC